MTSRFLFIFILSIIIHSCFFKPKYQKLGYEGFVNNIAFLDYSHKGNDYKVLKDILLKVDSLVFVRHSIEHIYGKDYKSSTFKITVGLHLSTNCYFIDRGHKHKVFPEKVSFKLSIIEKDAALFYNEVVSQIYQNYKLETDSILYENGALSFNEQFFMFDIKALNSKTEPYILCSPQKAILLYIASDTHLEGDYIAYINSFMTYEATRGIKIQLDTTVFAPSFDHVLDRTNFISKYINKEF